MADVGHDDKFFQFSTVEDLRNELTADKKGKSLARRRATLKRIIANATMGNDMQELFPEVVECMDIAAIDVKKMVCAYCTSRRPLHYQLRKLEQGSAPVMHQGLLTRLHRSQPASTRFGTAVHVVSAEPPGF